MSWLNTWSKRIKLTVSGTEITEDLTDFPVLITLSSGTGITNTDTTSVFDELVTVSGTKKIAITTTISEVETECYTEIERWDWENEQAWLWTKIPTIASGIDTTLYLYYDSTQPDNVTYVGDTGDIPAQNVWDDNFVGVWHMAQDPNGDVSGVVLDSTGNNNHGTPAGSMISDDLVDSKIGKGIDFDGGDDRIVISDSVALRPSTATLELCWYVSGGWAALSGNYFLLSKCEGNAGGDDNIAISLENDGTTRLWADDGSTNHFAYSIATAWSDTYHYVVGSLGGSGISIYTDGIFDQTTETYTSGLSPLEVDLEIGSLSSNRTLSMNGTIDEVRISNIERSSEWIKATYYSNFNNLITFYSEESIQTYYFSGYVKEGSIAASRTVRLYRRDTGALIASTTASGNGYYYLETTYSGTHYLIALDDDVGDTYNLARLDKVVPIAIS